MAMRAWCACARVFFRFSVSLLVATRAALRLSVVYVAVSFECIESEDAAVWGISPDGAGSHRKFRAKFGLPFTLLSDEDRTVIERYGAWRMKNRNGREYMGVVRSSFLVDPDGKVARAWPQVTDDGHAAEVKAAIMEARGASVR